MGRMLFCGSVMAEAFDGWTGIHASSERDHEANECLTE